MFISIHKDRLKQKKFISIFLGTQTKGIRHGENANIMDGTVHISPIKSRKIHYMDLSVFFCFAIEAGFGT